VDWGARPDPLIPSTPHRGIGSGRVALKEYPLLKSSVLEVIKGGATSDHGRARFAPTGRRRTNFCPDRSGLSLSGPAQIGAICALLRRRLDLTPRPIEAARHGSDSPTEPVPVSSQSDAKYRTDSVLGGRLPWVRPAVGRWDYLSRWPSDFPSAGRSQAYSPSA
jgi:hypothetical protein